MTIREGYRKMFLKELRDSIDNRRYNVIRTTDGRRVFTATTNRCKIFYYANDSKILFKSKNSFVKLINVTDKLKTLMKGFEDESA